MPDNRPLWRAPIPLWRIDMLAHVAEARGDHARAIWIRSQAQEIQACLERGADWPEVFGR